MADSAADRAEKAARAKDRLKKFQAKKRATEPVTSTTKESSATPDLVASPLASNLSSDIQTIPATTQDDGIPVEAQQSFSQAPQPTQPTTAIESPSLAAVDHAPPTNPTHLPTPDPSTSQQQTIAFLVGEKSMLHGELQDSRQEIDRLEKELVQIQHTTSERIDSLSQELDQSRKSYQKLESDLSASTQLINSLRNELQQTKAEVTDLRRSHADGKDGIVREFESKLRMKQHNADALESELSRAKSQLKSRDDQHRDQTHSLDKLNQQISSLQDEIREKNIRLSTTTHDLDTLQLSHRQAQSDLSSVQNHLKEKESRLSELQSDYDSLNFKLSNAQTSHDSLADTISSLEQKLVESNSRKDSLQSDNRSLLDSLEELRLKIVELTDVKLTSGEKLEEFRKIVREREHELVTMREELTSERQNREQEKKKLEQQMATLQNQFDSQKVEFDATKGQLMTELQQTKDDLKTTTQKLKEDQSQYDELAQQIRQEQAICRSLNSKLDSMNLKNTELDGKLAEKEEKMREIIDEVEQLKLKLDSISQDLSLEKRRNSELEQQHEEALAKLQESKNLTIDQLTVRLNDSDKQIEELSQTLDQKSFQLQLAESTHLDVSEKLSLAASDLESTKSKLHNVKTRLVEVEGYFKAQTDEKNELVGSLKSLQEQIVKLELQLADSKSEAENMSNQIQQAEADHRKQLEEYSSRLSSAETRAIEDLEDRSRKIDGLTALIETLKADLSRSELTCDELKTKSSNLESEVASNLSAMNEISKRLEDTVQSNQLVVSRMENEQRLGKSEYESRIEALENALVAKEASHQELIEMTEGLKTRLQSIEGERERLRIQLEECQSDLAEQRESLSSVLHDLVTEKNNLSELESELREKKNELEELVKSKETVDAEFKSHRDSASQKLNGLQKSVNSHLKKIELQDEQLNQSEQRAVELQDEIAKLEQEKSGLIKEMEEGKEGENRILEKSRSEILELKKKIGQLKAEGELAKQDLGQTKLEFEQNDLVKEGEIHRLNEELKEFQKNDIALRDQLEKALTEHQTSVKIIGELKKAVRAVEQTKQSLEENLRDELGKSQKTVTDQAVQLQDLINQLTMTREQAQTSSTEALAAQQNFEQESSKKEKQIAELKATLESLKIEHDDNRKISNEKISEISEQLKVSKSLQTQLEEQLASLRTDFGQSDLQRAQEHEERLAQKDAEREEIRALLKSKEEQLNTVQSKLDQFAQSSKTEVDRYQDLLKTNESIIAELRAEVGELKAQIVQSRADNEGKIEKDYVDSILQQHLIDLSTARSQIRSLESRVFEEESKSHAMLTRVEDLQDQLRGAEVALRVQRTMMRDSIDEGSLPLSPGTKPTKLATTNANDNPIDSSPVMVFNNLVNDSYPNIIDESVLSAETRHNRRQSLNLLKTRMEEELGLLDLSDHHSPNLLKKSIGNQNLGSVQEESGLENAQSFYHHHSRAKLGDDMVWCGDCVGDLFVV